MNRFHPVVLVILLVFLLFGGFYWYSHHREAQIARDAVLESQISAKTTGLEAVNKEVDRLAGAVVVGSARIDTLVRKVTLVVHDTVTGATRIDSVFADTLFSRLSDEQKVEVLRLAALKLSNSCSALSTACQQARDSAKAVISLWKERFDNKPRRRCGIGATLGVGAGVNSAFAPQAIVGVMAGFTCNF